MKLGDLAWDYSEAYDDEGIFLNPQACIILSYPSPPEPGRSALVLDLDGKTKRVPIEFLLPFW